MKILTTTLDSKMSKSGYWQPRNTYPSKFYNLKRIKIYLNAIDKENIKHEQTIKYIQKKHKNLISLYKNIIAQEESKPKTEVSDDK